MGEAVAPGFPGRRWKKFFITIERDEDGGFVVKCPSLPGCVSEGDTREAAIENIREAIQGSLETRRANGIPVAVETLELDVFVE
ncbi:MAG TPA: type II toxin-antitoxin system HicB family antitoxin [Candidatus Binataceae bacterium]|nr:type II toxin-antitoxin system HicB family antitoxin [Candidatus Binataceae bacterium]